MILDLEENEIISIVNVLGQLPTESNAWPLQQKIKYQFEQTKKTSTDGAQSLESVDEIAGE